MFSKKQILLIFSVALILPCATFLMRSQEGSRAILAVSDGKGGITLLWIPPASQWPAGGWSLADSNGKILNPHITAADPTALESLSVEDADAIRRLPEAFSKSQPANRLKQLYGIIVLRALSDPAYARGLGLNVTVRNEQPGARSYIATALGADGKPNGLTLRSAPIDASIATPLPASPDGLHVQSSLTGVAIGWNPPANSNPAIPVIAYTIERDGGGQNNSAVNAKPIVPGLQWNAKIPLVVDHNAPPNQMLTYRVYALDAFGRRSAPASIHYFFPDFAALEPPHPVLAQSTPGKITLTWPVVIQANRAGFIVERSHLFDGPYESLTAESLPPETAQFEDANLQPGTVYYYRVRAVNSRGDLGTPSAPASVQARSLAPPPAVQGLAANQGQTRIRLTWTPVPALIAGYFVERRVTTGANANEPWVRLNAHLTPEPLYDDLIGQASAVTMEYRVLAVANDSIEGLPSTTVRVTLPDISIPEQPSIIGTSGANGKAQIDFTPAPPLERIANFLVLRCGNEKDPGVVIGDPLPATARQFTDLYVSAGESYFYRLVAVGKNGYRSDPTSAGVIRVGAPQIAAPATPTAAYAASPFPHVTLTFAAPTAGLAIIVERQQQNGIAWTRIAGPLTTNTAIDFNMPASGQLSYRITYQSSNGTLGPASAVVQAIVPAHK